jgi:hypothetical protein
MRCPVNTFLRQCKIGSYSTSLFWLNLSVANIIDTKHEGNQINLILKKKKKKKKKKKNHINTIINTKMEITIKFSYFFIPRLLYH